MYPRTSKSFFLPCAVCHPLALHRATRTPTPARIRPTPLETGISPHPRTPSPPQLQPFLPSSSSSSAPTSLARQPPPPPMATSTRALLLLPILLLFLLSRSISLRADPDPAVSRIAFGSCANQSAPQVLDEMCPPFAVLISDQWSDGIIRVCLCVCVRVGSPCGRPSWGSTRRCSSGWGTTCTATTRGRSGCSGGRGRWGRGGTCRGSTRRRRPSCGGATRWPRPSPGTPSSGRGLRWELVQDSLALFFFFLFFLCCISNCTLKPQACVWCSWWHVGSCHRCFTNKYRCLFLPWVHVLDHTGAGELMNHFHARKDHKIQLRMNGKQECLFILLLLSCLGQFLYHPNWDFATLLSFPILTAPLLKI